MPTTTVTAPKIFELLKAMSRQTVKGEVLHQLAEATGSPVHEHASLRLAADVVDRELITVGANGFQLVVLNTATGSTSTVLDSTSTADVRETITAHGLARGAVLRCESEFLLVKSVIDANTVVLGRGHAGSTVASHADATAIYKQEATALTAGKIVLPLGATLTPAAAGPMIAAGLTALNTKGWTFTYASNYVDGFRAADGTHDATTETLTGVNNAWSAAVSFGGATVAQAPYAATVRVPTAAEVTRGVMLAMFPFTPVGVKVSVFTTASGAAVAWGGTFAIDDGLVTLTNGTDPDWAATDTVIIEAFG